MMPLWTSEDIASATGGSASADFEIGGVSFDSREVGPGDLFLALKGEHSDGHRFLGDAFANGAAWNNWVLRPGPVSMLLYLA
jgi:UDP-N-acetylmuramoyl-tripeptide--D-alanyl-D-alanine ligase